MEFPPEILSKIISYITDPRDVFALTKTSPLISSITQRCVEVLRYDSRGYPSDFVHITLVVKLRHLRIIKPYVSLRYVQDIVLVAQLPHICEVAFALEDLEYEWAISRRDFAATVMDLFLSAFHRNCYVNGDGDLIENVRYVQPENRFTFVCPNRIDVIIRGDAFAFLSRPPDENRENDEVAYYAVASRYMGDAKLFANTTIATSSYENFLTIKEFHFTLDIDIYVDVMNTILNSIAYMNNEGLLRKAKMYTPDGGGYYFNPAASEKDDLPATNEIELDIPFVLDDNLIQQVIEWFPKMTLVGLYLDSGEEIEKCKEITSLLTSRNIKVKVYTSIFPDSLDYQDDLVSIVKPERINISSVV